ncbi:hypothetical protein LRS37_12965 [Neobacillus sedimentimangrovi]|uniref:Ig-like domain-containing protein n=1 Tax=Neobacillus sedimentimangrovi TaxID=2699460 RepID=A0ABS8QLR6_9BACI|nr:hypothetical protein [Neobacillus sedimentimangrovi]MCD4839761.1 hypothetical protein [Neobacillus sedimentimangrovi]
MASGQVTLVDINDSRQLQLYINSSQPKTQIFNPNDNSYTPNWTTSKPVLTPQLFIAGDNTDIISEASSIKWFIDGVELTTSNTDYTLGIGNRTLTINTNILANTHTKLFVVEVVYSDPVTGFDTVAKADIEFVKVSSGQKGDKGADGQDAVRAVVWTPEGNVIRNSTGTLKAQCDLYKGSSKITSGVTYQWYQQDPNVTTDQGGGIGWKKITNLTGYNTATLTIPASAIASVESFKCVTIYSSKTYSDVCTVSDVSDPLQVVIVGANIFKNGEGSVTLTAKVYRAGTELDQAGTQYTYTWSIYNADNTKTSFSKTGKTITVNASDINGRGNLVCEVS